MEDRKFNVCNLALDTVLIKMLALGNYDMAKTVLKDIQMKEEDITEKTIALEIDDVYEECVLREPDDPDSPLLEEIIKVLIEELPNKEDYKKLYNWDI